MMLKSVFARTGLTTFVLVPGAWLGGWAWNRVTPLLEKKGHNSYPVTLTGMGDRVHLASKDVGMETAIQDVLNVIEYNDLSNIVLVGHSFAGKVAAAVADRAHKKVRLVLYLDAFRPAKVRTPQAALNPNEFSRPPGSWEIPFSEKIIETIGKDVQGVDREWLLSRATPWPVKLAADPIILSQKFDAIRSAYILCTGSGDPVDEIVAGKWGKLEGPYKIMEAGHWPMITKPEELVRDMLELTSS
jgi:pimeloyl-ACP methyl ester carboxylesterase